MEKYALKVEEVGEILGISRASAYNLARSKGFPSLRVGKRLIVPREAFFRWMETKINDNDA
jgi:excisionase family DNA binding protein